jgi:hypothetical protein
MQSRPQGPLPVTARPQRPSSQTTPLPTKAHLLDCVEGKIQNLQGGETLEFAKGFRQCADRILGQVEMFQPALRQNHNNTNNNMEQSNNKPRKKTKRLKSKLLIQPILFCKQ